MKECFDRLWRRRQNQSLRIFRRLLGAGLLLFFLSATSVQGASRERTPAEYEVFAGTEAASTVLQTETEQKPEEESGPEEETWQKSKENLLSLVDACRTEEETILFDSDILLSEEGEHVQKILEEFQDQDIRVGFMLLDLNSGSIFGMDSSHVYYGASTLKGPYVAAMSQFMTEEVCESERYSMENAITWSSNEDYEILRIRYEEELLDSMAEYADVSETLLSEQWYPSMSVKELTKLWVGVYWYFFEETNENSEWCRSIYTQSTESFIHSALGDQYTVYTKPGWICDYEDVARNDAGIVMADENPYILVIMSEAYDYYEELEELTLALDQMHDYIVLFHI